MKDFEGIDFHDLPVERIRVVSDPDLMLVVSFFRYIEALKEYQKQEMVFQGISGLKIGQVLLDSESDLEIHSFEYQFNGEFDGKMTFLSGHGQPGFEMEIRCRAIEINTVPG